MAINKEQVHVQPCRHKKMIQKTLYIFIWKIFQYKLLNQIAKYISLSWKIPRHTIGATAFYHVRRIYTHVYVCAYVPHIYTYHRYNMYTCIYNRYITDMCTMYIICIYTFTSMDKIALDKISPENYSRNMWRGKL